MTFDIAPGLTAFLVGFVVVAVLALAALAAVVVTTTVPFFARHRAVRTQRRESFAPYYRRLALHH